MMNGLKNDLDSQLRALEDEYIKKKEKKPSDLWHYTSADGLLGITKEPGKMHFWFTRSDYLNDPSEGNYVLELFNEIRKNLLENGKISEAFDALLQNLSIPEEQFITYKGSDKGKEGEDIWVIGSQKCHAFICSFSTKEDSLDMWRYYSKGNGGYALKFLSSILYSDKANKEFIQPYKVIYEKEKQTQYIEQIIMSCFNVYEKSAKILKLEEEIVKSIRGILKNLQFRFKHECYSSEKEFRFVFYLPVERPRNLSEKIKLPEVLYDRMQDGVLIPYIDIATNESLLEVTISPFISSDKAKESVEGHLKKHGYNCKVTLSELPVRK